MKLETLNDKIIYARGWNDAIEACAKLIESGAGMADLIDQEELDQQAKYIRALDRSMQTDDGGY